LDHWAYRSSPSLWRCSPGSAAEGDPGPHIRAKPQVRRMEPGENRRIA
jgi:hypothetical protein